jgi:hypothetical protein
MARKIKRGIEDSLFKKTIIRTFLLIGGFIGSIASFIFTCRSLLIMAPQAIFSTHPWLWNSDTYLYVAFGFAGITISLTQISTMILYFIKGKNAYHLLLLYSLATIVSMFITVNTLSLGVNRESVSAKTGDNRYQALINEEQRLIKVIDELDEQRKEEHDARHWTTARSYKQEIMTYNVMLQNVRVKINNFDGSNIITLKKNFETISLDIKELFGKQTQADSNDRFALFITYFLFIAISLIVDVGPNMMMSYGVIGIMEVEKEREENNKKKLPDNLDKPLSKMSLDEVKKALPYAPSVYNVFGNLWENALADDSNENASMLISAGGGSGKTRLLCGALEKANNDYDLFNECDIVVFDPKKKQKGKWPTVPIGYGQNFDDIIFGLKKLKDICEFRSKNIGVYKPIIVIIDEMYAIGRYCKENKINWGELWVWIVTFGRENRIYLIGLSQSDTAESTGTKGEHDVLDSFGIKSTIKFHIGRKMRWAEIKMTSFAPELYFVPMIKKPIVFNTQKTPSVMGDTPKNNDYNDDLYDVANEFSLTKMLGKVVSRKINPVKNKLVDKIANKVAQLEYNEKQKQSIIDVQAVEVKKDNKSELIEVEDNKVKPNEINNPVESNIIALKDIKRNNNDDEIIDRITSAYCSLEDRTIGNDLIVEAVSKDVFGNSDNRTREIVLETLKKNNLLEVKRARKTRN